MAAVAMKAQRDVLLSLDRIMLDEICLWEIAIRMGQKWAHFVDKPDRIRKTTQDWSDYVHFRERLVRDYVALGVMGSEEEANRALDKISRAACEKAASRTEPGHGR